MHAALFNGIASHVHDYNDTYLDTIIHPTGPVACALLAIAETLDHPVLGTEFLTALVAGIVAEYVGWHITSTVGSIGAAVAVAKLLALSADQVAHAIGVAATQVTGLREMFGSHTKSFHPGRAAQNGLVAGLLAREGFTSSVQALEAKRGWANVVSSGHRLDEEIAGLGDGRWEIARNAFKPFPCGIVVHPVIDGCVWLHGELERVGIDVEEVEEVIADVHPLVLQLTGKTAPKAYYHGGAVGLLFGKATPAQYEDHIVVDERIVALRNRFRAVPDEGLRADEYHLAGGSSIEKHVDFAVGSLERPMTDDELARKFVDQCAAILGPERTHETSQWCRDLERQTDIRRIKDVL
ncbi:hypothetical protein N7457_001735 [Penicillium paradoxum]|uniref:uncharacterized protein n=1 Tax=Penicillium paradoxum TaxID=176176 RepID=UPI002548AF61|nr:uncharacterized protein N7457_001735 [Penicillium paradoxum]KAJ5795136.1 hypothetical protein N7457_001735 [Penicillium paradoxum]